MGLFFKKSVGKNNSRHGLSYRTDARTKAGVMPSLNLNGPFLTVDIDGSLRSGDGRGRFDGHAHDDRLAGGDTAQNPAGPVREKAPG
jgi:hypothetical protein